MKNIVENRIFAYCKSPFSWSLLFLALQQPHFRCGENFPSLLCCVWKINIKILYSGKTVHHHEYIISQPPRSEKWSGWHGCFAQREFSLDRLAKTSNLDCRVCANGSATLFLRFLLIKQAEKAPRDFKLSNFLPPLHFGVYLCIFVIWLL